mmetsp:Transcript_16031/g.34815  ORF Transcript_16031/g.34815 Transcript_16031/m.34815 type:complete len:85 (+) Transcript_16031:149-403(+)
MPPSLLRCGAFSGEAKPPTPSQTLSPRIPISHGMVGFIINTLFIPRRTPPVVRASGSACRPPLQQLLVLSTRSISPLGCARGGG